MTTWTVWCDGSAIPNPGRMGLGVLLISPEGARHELSESPSDTGCNNEAELRAVVLALKALRARGARHATVHSDNSILVAQLGAGAKGRAAPVARLDAMFDDARALLRTFDSVELTWLPRARNAVADGLARAALGVGPKQRKAKHTRP